MKQSQNVIKTLEKLRKLNKHDIKQLYFGILLLLCLTSIALLPTYKICTSFKVHASKKRSNMVVKKALERQKCVEKISVFQLSYRVKNVH